MNFLRFDGTLAPGAETVALRGEDVAVPRQREAASGQLVLGVRPEHVRLSDEGGYRGQVIATEYLGTTQIITLETPNGEIKARAPAHQVARVGETVGLQFRGEAVTLFDEASGRALRSALNEGVLANG
jgi:multiple sugar transport system ATP-binding protein